MNIGARLEAIGRLVPQNVSIADIGTDHAYLPTWLAERCCYVQERKPLVCCAPDGHG